MNSLEEVSKLKREYTKRYIISNDEEEAMCLGAIIACNKMLKVIRND